MNNEPNKPVETEELTDKELEGIVGGALLYQDVIPVLVSRNCEGVNS